MLRAAAGQEARTETEMEEAFARQLQLPRIAPLGLLRAHARGRSVVKDTPGLHQEDERDIAAADGGTDADARRADGANTNADHDSDRDAVEHGARRCTGGSPGSTSTASAHARRRRRQMLAQPRGALLLLKAQQMPPGKETPTTTKKGLAGASSTTTMTAARGRRRAADGAGSVDWAALPQGPLQQCFDLLLRRGQRVEVGAQRTKQAAAARAAF